MNCSSCGKSVKMLGAFGGVFSPSASVVGVGSERDFDLYEAQVCTACAFVFCRDCMELGRPTPCPKCGKPTEPAYARTVSRLSIRKYCNNKVFQGNTEDKAMNLAKMVKVDKDKVVFLKVTKSVSEHESYGESRSKTMAVSDAREYFPRKAFDVSVPVPIQRGIFPFRKWKVKITYKLPAEVTLRYRV